MSELLKEFIGRTVIIKNKRELKQENVLKPILDLAEKSAKVVSVDNLSIGCCFAELPNIIYLPLKVVAYVSEKKGCSGIKGTISEVTEEFSKVFHISTSEDIMWEQRRYEIAKDLFVSQLHDVHIIQGLEFNPKLEQRVAAAAIIYADALVDKLRNG